MVETGTSIGRGVAWGGESFGAVSELGESVGPGWLGAPTLAVPGQAQLVQALFGDFVEGILTAVPAIVGGLVFLLLAYLAIKLVLRVVRAVMDGVYPENEQLVVDLTVAVVGLFLWFGAALAFLKIVGLGDVAASLGTAGGFVGLGVAFALKEMIADTVAGVYLLRDPAFEEGDPVDAASVVGEVETIGLRKTRIRAEDDSLVVVSNREVEKKWINKRRMDDAEPVDDGGPEV